MNRLFSLFLVLSVVLVSCTKETGGGGGPESTQITLNVSEARPLQILPVLVTGVDVYGSTYEGAIGGVEVTFVPSNSVTASSLVCVVPENVGTGIQMLSIDIDGQTLTESLNVLPNEAISTPIDVFDEFFADYTTADYAEFIDEVELQDALDDLRALPQSDQLIAAQMLANNRVVLDNIAQVIADAENQTGLGFGKTQSCDLLCIIGAATAVVGSFLAAPIVTAVGVGVLAGLVAKALKPVVTALWNKLATGVVAALRLGYDRMSYLTELVFDEADQMLSNKVEEMPDTIYLENGRPLKLAIKTVREPLISESNRSEYPEVGSFLDVYYKLEAFLQGTDYLVPALESGEVSDFAPDLDGFSISVDNPLVTVSPITGTPELAEVVFDSPQQGAHIFNFTYSYENEEGLVSSFTQTARLLNFGQYANWSGSGVSFSDTDSRNIVGETHTITGWIGREYEITLGNFSSRYTSPQTSGVETLNEVYFDLTRYTGPGVYPVADINVTPVVGISDASAKTNVQYDFSIGQIVGSNHCNFSETTGSYIGYSGTVTINDEEWVGTYLILEGVFNLTIDPLGGVSQPCTSPATFTGDFRVAANTQ